MIVYCLLFVLLLLLYCHRCGASGRQRKSDGTTMDSAKDPNRSELKQKERCLPKYSANTIVYLAAIACTALACTALASQLRRAIMLCESTIHHQPNARWYSVAGEVLA